LLRHNKLDIKLKPTPLLTWYCEWCISQWYIHM